MIPLLQSALFFLLAAVVFLFIGSAAAAGIARYLGDRILSWEPRTRHRALVLLALLPVLTSLGLLLSVSLPSLVALVVPGLDHCPFHDDGHAHLCFRHLPEVSQNFVLTLGLVFVVSYVGVRSVLSAKSILRALRALKALVRTGQWRADLGVTVIEATQPICVAAGIFKPQILLSRGLLESLDDAERSVVLAHERAHIQRRDALVACIVQACAPFHSPPVARWLTRELAIAAEQACDEAAGMVVDDRVAVAATILAVERAAQHASPELGLVAVAFGECAVERRVESLLGEPRAPASLRPIYVTFVLAAVALLAAADGLHHATESLLSIIAH